jgi:hypothetical protein
MTHQEFEESVRRIVRAELTRYAKRFDTYNKPILTEKDFYRLFGVPLTTQRDHRRNGKLPFFRVGKKPLYLAKDVIEFLTKEPVSG